MPPTSEHPNRKFTADVRKEYLDLIRSGRFLKMRAAEQVGVSYRTVERFRADNDDFRDEERLALQYALEGKEAILSDMADQGDLGALKMWLQAHGRSTYADRQVIEHDATPAALEMSANDALARVAELQKELEARRERLLASGDVIDVEEIPAEPEDLPALPESDYGEDSHIDPSDRYDDEGFSI